MTSYQHGRWCRAMIGLFVVCFTATAINGCSGLASGGPEQKQMQCETEFRIDDNSQPLGSSERFRHAAIQSASTGTQVTTLHDVAREAGWTGAWDRVLQAFDNTDSASTNASAGTTGICFLGVSRSDPDFGAQGDYIFFDGPRPVQSMHWDGATEIMRALGDSTTIRRDEPLTAETDSDPPMLVTVETRSP
ncbi:hypothetical protein ACFUEJ_16670 [Gordonia sp. NPDC057258]|uniref:hypothetical protein n=1 Tax=unclassified Gordonia (in: high G+C Gram-positive bacteria) TaxID=2657482 RepID=UPI00363B9B95